jgi:hypothetical protein
MAGNRDRWVRVGQAGHEAAGEAGEAASAEACGPNAKLLVVFASFTYQPQELLAGVSRVAGDVPVIGCTTAGEIGPASDERPSVVVVGLGGEFDISVGCATGFADGPRRLGEALATMLLPFGDRRENVVLMLTDSLAGDQQEMLRGAYGVVGATVPFVGGGAGDDMRMETSYQFFQGRVVRDSVVAASIRTDGPVGYAVGHGWTRTGSAMVVTASRDNDVYTLDDRPALDVYLERHHAPSGIEVNRTSFATFALTRPLSVARRGQVAVRHVLTADPEGRRLGCAGSVPRGSTVWLSEGDVASTLAATDLVCAEAVRGVPVPRVLLVFDCVGRRAVLDNDGLAAERTLMRRHAGAAPVSGFYSYGEIARFSGPTGFHNQTIVALALG